VAGTLFHDNCVGCPELVMIPAGSFTMGSVAKGRSEDEGSAHAVRSGYRFAAGRYPVTRGEWRQFVKESGHPNSAGEEGGDWDNPAWVPGAEFLPG
jgi:formylglycine-generating enzyme required for sulfatase activity